MCFKAGREDYCAKLMTAENDGLIVLFSEYGVGTVIYPAAMRGHYSKTWIMSEFTDFDGSITLCNGE